MPALVPKPVGRRLIPAVLLAGLVLSMLCVALPGIGAAQPAGTTILDDGPTVTPELTLLAPTQTAAGTVSAPTVTMTPVLTVPAPTPAETEPVPSLTSTPIMPTATSTPGRVLLPLVLRYQVGPEPTATATPTATHTPTATCTATITATPTNTVPPTPPIVDAYGALSISGASTDLPAAEHPDLNLSIRGYQSTQAALTLIDLDGSSDPNAPQLRGLCDSWVNPWFVSAHQVYDWDWENGQRGGLLIDPEVTLLAVATQATELVRTPPSGYDLGEGYGALVLYARSDAITVKYTREDNVVHGYTLHLEGIQVDPALLALYDGLNEAGRGYLPALRGGQAFGWAASAEIRIAVRDSGTFMDPRSRKDWWRDW